MAGSVCVRVRTAMAESSAARDADWASVPIGAAVRSTAARRSAHGDERAPRFAVHEVVEKEEEVENIIVEKRRKTRTWEDRVVPEACFDFAGVYDSGRWLEN